MSSATQHNRTISHSAECISNPDHTVTDKEISPTEMFHKAARRPQKVQLCSVTCMYAYSLIAVFPFLPCTEPT